MQPIDLAVSRILFLTPLILSFLTSVVIGVISWKRRSVNGSAIFAYVAFLQAFTTVGLIAQTVSPTLDLKLFWDGVQFIGMVWVLAWFGYVLKFTGHSLRSWFPVMLIGALVYIVIVLLSYTDSLRHLIRSDLRIVPAIPFDSLVYREEIGMVFGRIFIFGFLIASMVLLMLHIIRSHTLYRIQGILNISGIAVILAGELFAATISQGTTIPAMFPYTFAVFNLLVFWGIFAFRLFEIAPIARDWVFENLPDAVFVLDVAGRVVDRNQSAALLESDQNHVGPGRLFQFGSMGWEEFQMEFSNLYERGSKRFPIGEDGAIVELTVWPLQHRSKLVGRIVLIHVWKERQA